MGRARLSRDERRQHIIESAIDIFSQRGFHGTRMEDISRAADINISLIYQHFPHKEDLFDAIFATLYAGNPMITRLAEIVQEGTDQAVFRYFAESYVSVEERDIKIQRLLVFAALERPDLARRHFEEREANVIAILARYIEKRVADGVFHPLDALLTARLFAAQASMYVLEARVLNNARWEGYGQEVVLSAMVDTFIEGLKQTSSEDVGGVEASRLPQ